MKTWLKKPRILFATAVALTFLIALVLPAQVLQDYQVLFLVLIVLPLGIWSIRLIKEVENE